MKRWLAAAGVVILFVAASGAAASQSEPEGFPDPGASLTDESFGVATREFGLDRRVEMYQWRAIEGGYERVWHGAPIDSSGFAPGHENPAAMPLENQRWWAPEPTLDGRPLEPAVLRSLGEWRVLHPTFAKLPSNLAASFQPEGDGLGSAEDPLDPQIGDLRVTWRELVLPPLSGKLALRGGVWRLAAASGDPAGVPATPQPGKAQRLWPWFGGGLVVILAIWVAFRRRAARRKSGSESRE